MMCDNGLSVVDVEKVFEDEYVKYCCWVDEIIVLLCNCYLYYNGEGKVELGSFVYYGGFVWYEV